MKAKLITGAVVIAVAGLVGGAVLSDQVLASDGDASEIADLRRQVEEGQRDLRTLQEKLSGERGRKAAQVPALTEQVEMLQAKLDAKDEAISDLNARLEDLLAAGENEGRDELSREEQWKKIQDTLAGVWAILVKLDQPGANQYELGPQLVVELGKLSSEQYDEIMAYDEDETDPEKVREIAVIMQQAFLFVRGISEKRNDFMERYLERALNGGYGERFTSEALRRTIVSVPPFFDGYQKIIAPLDDEIESKFLDVALDRAARGTSESLRLDGAAFLGKVDDPRATAELLRVFGQPANSQRLRLTALQSLSNKADTDVLRTLRDAEQTEQDEAVRAQVGKAVARVEQLIARKR
jgi:hypothetical protein